MGEHYTVMAAQGFADTDIAIPGIFPYISDFDTSIIG
jgi:hypothetical protein